MSEVWCGDRQGPRGYQGVVPGRMESHTAPLGGSSSRISTRARTPARTPARDGPSHGSKERDRLLNPGGLDLPPVKPRRTLTASSALCPSPSPAFPNCSNPNARFKESGTPATPKTPITKRESPFGLRSPGRQVYQSFPAARRHSPSHPASTTAQTSFRRAAPSSSPPLKRSGSAPQTADGKWQTPWDAELGSPKQARHRHCL
ncbi:hypothetical protein B0T18DRAFT_98633 [Schizothecium vesticola]|uniref:Uncharacterized protein n=1 Tax=Schizothecium vesticola TaxID=314040 RepID=A0AA40F0X9_9PEZI|nr:hypothetical protein B0T18DRAFT_98633 [Schizothecium vesticola]